MFSPSFTSVLTAVYPDLGVDVALRRRAVRVVRRASTSCSPERSQRRPAARRRRHPPKAPARCERGQRLGIIGVEENLEAPALLGRVSDETRARDELAHRRKCLVPATPTPGPRPSHDSYSPSSIGWRTIRKRRPVSSVAVSCPASSISTSQRTPSPEARTARRACSAGTWMQLTTRHPARAMQRTPRQPARAGAASSRRRARSSDAPRYAWRRCSRGVSRHPSEDPREREDEEPRGDVRQIYVESN